MSWQFRDAAEEQYIFILLWIYKNIRDDLMTKIKFIIIKKINDIFSFWRNWHELYFYFHHFMASDESLTWWIGRWEMTLCGDELLKASERLIQAAKNWKGSSAVNHHWFPLTGLSAESNISWRWLSTKARRPSCESFSTPPEYRFAKCIFSQCKPHFPSRRPSANSSIPRQRSELKWFKCGCIGYARPRKSRLWG